MFHENLQRKTVPLSSFEGEASIASMELHAWLLYIASVLRSQYDVQGAFIQHQFYWLKEWNNFTYESMPIHVTWR